MFENLKTVLTSRLVIGKTSDPQWDRVRTKKLNLFSTPRTELVIFGSILACLTAVSANIFEMGSPILWCRFEASF